MLEHSKYQPQTTMGWPCAGSPPTLRLHPTPRTHKGGMLDRVRFGESQQFMTHHSMHIPLIQYQTSRRLFLNRGHLVARRRAAVRWRASWE